LQSKLLFFTTRMTHLITSESVTAWHPDKLCDQISDAILDAILTQDPDARVACECMAADTHLIIAWETRTTAHIDYEKIARDVIKSIGYDSDETYYNGDSVKIQVLIHTQSPDIAQWVDTGWAGDQWLMYGYATNETPEYMPLPITIAHQLAQRLHTVRKDKILTDLLPDGKTQVTIKYDNNKAIAIDTLLISSQHRPWYNQDILRHNLIHEVMKPVIATYGYDIQDVKHIFTNPTGIFEIGWPVGDCGLTWRKIIVDTYGGIGRHGWGAFSWKDPTKVDRSAAYMARYIAKNIVASQICDYCEVQLAYAIGVIQPVSVYVNCFGTAKVDESFIINTIKNNFDLSPTGIIHMLDLKKPIYQASASYGHFGRNAFTRERLDSVEIFKKL
jgi:S-adenosylmethionine synthetase